MHIAHFPILNYFKCFTDNLSYDCIEIVINEIKKKLIEKQTRTEK